jgi:hypothetical protein
MAQMPETRQLRSDVHIFFWLPKTSGGTLTTGIDNNPGVQRQLWPSPRELLAPSSAEIWFGGHLHFGHHLIYHAEPSYTVLRDPIERLISEFFYHHQHQLPGIFIPDDEIVPAFIRLVEAAPHLNYCSYMFSDYCFVKEAAAEGLPPWRGCPIAALDLLARRNERYGYLAENVPFHKIDVEEAFRRASKNIQLMRFIGFFNHLPETTTRLKREFAISVGLDLRMHKTTWKPHLDDLPSHVAAMLKRKTEADYELIHEAQSAPTAALPRAYRWWRKIARHAAA